MQEGAVLAKLKTKWWKEKRGGGACVDDDSDGGATPLEVANLAGVFLVLYVGTVIAFICGIVEWLFVIKAEAKKEQVPFCVKFKEEFKFMTTLSETTREVEPEEKEESSGSSSSTRASQRPNPNQSPKRDKAPHPVLPQLIHLPPNAKLSLKICGLEMFPMSEQIRNLKKAQGNTE
uniref:Uncharacterized protein n=1 Tax=Megaselia scalaris TaxID=36166 RepID=T1GH19_MEGSC